jgi:hypothetical protein
MQEQGPAKCVAAPAEKLGRRAGGFPALGGAILLAVADLVSFMRAFDDPSTPSGDA